MTTSRRDPPVGKLDELFSSKFPPLKRVGIMVFEVIPQETRSGLSGHDKVYLSAAGKQLLAEKMLAVWEESLPILAPNLDVVKTSKIGKSETFKKNGSAVEDLIKGRHSTLAPDDIFYLPPGKNTPVETLMNARRMRDFSLALVPAGELMAGPKFSEHQKHAVNDLAKELKLDAVLIVYSKVSWTASHTDKHSGEFIPEEISLKLEATTLIPFGNYHQRLTEMGEKGEYPKVSVAYRTYSVKVDVPALISVPPEMENFNTIEKELLAPLMKSYNDLSQMMITRIASDLNGNL